MEDNEYIRKLKQHIQQERLRTQQERIKGLERIQKQVSQNTFQVNKSFLAFQESMKTKKLTPETREQVDKFIGNQRSRIAEWDLDVTNHQS